MMRLLLLLLVAIWVLKIMGPQHVVRHGLTGCC